MTDITKFNDGRQTIYRARTFPPVYPQQRRSRLPWPWAIAIMTVLNTLFWIGIVFGMIAAFS